MPANYRVPKGRAPRTHYGTRKLVPVTKNSTSERLYGKGLPRPQNDNTPTNDNTPDESLPRGWSILEPNRVKERRLAAGYKTTDALALKINSISYQRLHKIENGIVVVRDSEYELIARALNLQAYQLQLPMLMHSETVRWMEIWGPDKKIEEGGDHDAVLLAAYVRYHADRVKMGVMQIPKRFGAPLNCMHFIWHAAKPIDRYPDSTMMVTMKLTGHDSWDKVIAASHNLYREGKLKKFVELVRKPRVRYAPEDPSKMAPWTYDTNPFRTRKPKERFVNSYTSRRTSEKDARLRKMAARRDDMHKRIRYYQDIRKIINDAIACENPVHLLADMFPDFSDIIIEGATENYARHAYARVSIVDYLIQNDDLFVSPIKNIFGVTNERVRQLKAQAKEEGFEAIFPKNSSTKKELVAPKWEDFKNISIKRRQQ